MSDELDVENMSPAELRALRAALLRPIQSAGGRAVQARRTPEERSALGRKAVNARWAKARRAARKHK